MNAELISRLVGLIQKTGDKVVLADSQTGKAVVVMDLESYEKMTADRAVAKPAPEKAAPVVENVLKNIVDEAPIKAQHSENPFKVRGTQLGVVPRLQTGALGDLTQEELLDKINRDIGTWKTAQERKRTDELKSAATPSPRFEAAVLEEEERFYLEPIE